MIFYLNFRIRHQSSLLLISIYIRLGSVTAYHQYFLIKTTPISTISQFFTLLISSIATLYDKLQLQSPNSIIINSKSSVLFKLMTHPKNKVILSTFLVFVKSFFCLSTEIKRVLTMFVNHSSGSLLVRENGDFKIMFTKQNISEPNVFRIKWENEIRW